MTAPTAPVIDRPDRRARRVQREGRQGTALFITTVILLVVALGAAGAALVVRHDTDDLQARAEPVHEQVRDLTAAEADAERRLRLLRDEARATNESLTALFAAEQAQVDASNHAVDVANQAVDQYNNAQNADLAGAFQAAGDAALADLEAKTAAVRTAADAAHAALARLQEEARG
jgi:chromosome segregation ATPase